MASAASHFRGRKDWTRSDLRRAGLGDRRALRSIGLLASRRAPVTKRVRAGIWALQKVWCEVTKKEMLRPSLDVGDDAFVVEKSKREGIRSWNSFVGEGMVGVTRSGGR